MLFILRVCCAFLACSLQPCGHLLGKGLTLGVLVCVVFLRFDTFSCGLIGKVWYFIESVPGLCLLNYSENWPSIFTCCPFYGYDSLFIVAPIHYVVLSIS